MSMTLHQLFPLSSEYIKAVFSLEGSLTLKEETSIPLLNSVKSGACPAKSKVVYSDQVRPPSLETDCLIFPSPPWRLPSSELLKCTTMVPSFRLSKAGSEK